MHPVRGQKHNKFMNQLMTQFTDNKNISVSVCQQGQEKQIFNDSDGTGMFCSIANNWKQDDRNKSH